MKNLSIVILAAGKGKRMRSALPKVLHQLGSRTLLEHVVNTVRQLAPKIYVVYGFGGEQVRDQLRFLEVTWIKQEEYLGTGHALLQALPHIDPQDQVLTLVGDCPLLPLPTLKKLLEVTNNAEIGLVTTEINDPTGLGRVLRDQTGKVLGIVEHKDATAKQRKINEINSGIILAPAKILKDWLPKLSNDNAQKEYYLTDIIAMACQQGLPIHSVLAESAMEVLGINQRAQLAKLERYFQYQQAQQLMLAGVTLMDPRRFDLRGNLDVGKDTLFDVNVVFVGNNQVGSNCTIGPNCYLRNVTIADNVTIQANSVIEEAVIDSDCSIGPFARIRPGTRLHKAAKIGNFVETKKADIGAGSKVNHLSYVGDTKLGIGVNVGAGTITCNYDGVNKHQTSIGDHVFIGSNSQLVAPVTIGANATIGAGSTITKNVPPNELALGRARQKTIPGWQRPQKKK